MVGGISSLLLLIWALVTLFLPLVLSAPPHSRGGGGAGFLLLLIPPVFNIPCGFS